MVAILVVVCLLSLVRTEPFRRGEQVLAGLAGSRQRAWAVVGFVIIAAVAAVNVYQFVH